MTAPIRILYVDDYPLDRALVRDALGSSSQDFELLEASTEKEFIELMKEGNFDLVLTDFNILGFTGLQVLEIIQARYPEIPVIMVTGTGSEEIAAEAIKRGAADYVIKTPHYIQRLPHTIQNALANQVLKQQRSEALQQLRENEEHYRELVENLNEGIWGIDQDNKTSFVNPAMAKILGYTVEEMLGKHLFDFMDQPQVENNLKRGKGGASGQYEFKFLHKDGSEIYTLINTQPLNDEQGNYQGALAAVQDITDRKLALHQLEENEQKYRSLVDNVGAALFLHNMDGRIVDVNQVTLKSYGYTREELLEMNAQDIDLEIDERGDREQFWNKLFQESPQRFEAQHRTRDGSTFPVEISLTPVTIAGEDHIIALAQDITERVQASRNLEQTKETLTTVLESVDAQIYVSDFENYEILYMNQKMAEVFGGDFTGKLCYQEFWGEENPCENCHLDQLVTEEGNPTGTRTWEGFNPKTERWYLNTDRAIYWTDQRLAHIQIAVDIHDRKLAEEKLQESEKFLREILDANPNCIFVKDWDGKYLLVNQAIANLYSMDPEQMLGKTDQELAGMKKLTAREAEAFLKDDRDVISSSHPKFIPEESFTTADGSLRWFTTQKLPLTFDPDQPKILGVAVDITEIKQAEEREQKLLERLQLAMESAGEGFWQYDAKSARIQFDELGYAMLGCGPDCPAQELEWWIDQVHPDQRRKVDEGFSRFLSGEEPEYIQEFQLKTREGNYLWVASTAQVIERDQTGKPISVVGLLQDINERKEAEIALRDSESRYRNLVESSPDGIVTISKTGKVMSINQRFLELTGYSREDFLNKNFLQVPTLLAQDLDFYKKIVPQILQGKKLDPIEFRWKHASGEIRDGEARTSALQVEGEVIGMLGIVRDITERKETEQKINESEQRYRQLYQNAGMGVGYWTTNGEVISFNEIALKHMQMTREQVVGKHLADIYPEELAEVYLERIQSVVKADKPLEFEDQVNLPSGTEWFLSLYSTVEDLEGKIQGVQISSLNITERKTAEQKLQEREAVLNRSQEIARVGSYIWDLRDDSLVWSDNMYRIHGLDPDQFSGNLTRVSQEVIHPEDRKQVAEEIQQMVQNKKVHSMQFRVLLADGQERVMQSSGEFEFDPDGHPIRAVGVHQDITDEIKAQQEILASRELLVRLSRAAHSVQNILDPEVIIDTVGREISALGFNTTILELSEDQTRLQVRFNSFSSQLVSKMIKLLGIKPEDFSFKIQPGGYFENVLQSGTTVLKPVESQPFQEVFPGIPRPVIKQIQMLFDYESTILAPLMNQDQPLGLLTVLGSEITEEDLTPIEIFANQASTALRNARYASALQERAEELVQLTTKLEEIEEAERTRMAQELHDQVGQSLALLGFNLNMIKSQLKEADVKNLEKIYDSQTLLEEISSGIRSVMDDLRPSILDDYGLLAALHWLSDKYTERTGIEVEVLGKASEPRLDRRMENSLFRIAQEALTNVARHAEADQVKINLIQTPKQIELILEDNGKGFDTETDPGDHEHRGWGLVNMNERANRIGGELILETNPGKGTRISIQIPRV